MFTQPAPAPTSPGLGTPTVSASLSASPPSSRSRLRGLSYLRNYTQTHLLSREPTTTTTTTTTNNNNNNNGQNGFQSWSFSFGLAASAAPAGGTAAANASVSNNSSPLPSPNHLSPLPDTDPSTTAPPSNPSSASRSNRFSLVPALSHPLDFSLGRSHDTNATPRRSTDASALPSIITTAAVGGIIDNSSIGTPPLTISAADDAMTRARSATTNDAQSRLEGGASMDFLPSIRFSAFYDPRATRPSLTFSPISRTLPTGGEVIRVGRYSERDNHPNIPTNVPSSAPVGFKSKVVSRRHCEFWYENGKWYIKDVKSSSGTFLNHIRLSPTGTESKPFAVNDGDIVQLGIDFKDGEEMIFRCVKMRLELNRGWQSKLNTFNMNTHKRLRNMTAMMGGAGKGSSGQSYSQDCSICLNSIAPCQCLFVAPCSHTWHYKCIKSLLVTPNYPIFICPNCRAAADLEAEVEDPEEWERLDSDELPQDGALLEVNGNQDTNGAAAMPRKSRESVRSVRPALAIPSQSSQPSNREGDRADLTMLLEALPPQTTTATAQAERADSRRVSSENISSSVPNRPFMSSHTVSNPLPIPSSVSAGPRVNGTAGDGRRDARTPSPTGIPVLNGNQGPITPRNDAGPWVFDGSGIHARVEGSAGGRTSTEGVGGIAGGPRITSLETTVGGGGDGHNHTDVP